MKKKTPYRISSQLPIDTRLIPDILTFGHVKGVARAFLIIEMTLSVLIVCGTILTVFLKVFGL